MSWIAGEQALLVTENAQAEAMKAAASYSEVFNKKNAGGNLAMEGHRLQRDKRPNVQCGILGTIANATRKGGGGLVDTCSGACGSGG